MQFLGLGHRTANKPNKSVISVGRYSAASLPNEPRRVGGKGVGLSDGASRRASVSADGDICILSVFCTYWHCVELAPVVIKFKPALCSRYFHSQLCAEITHSFKAPKT